jgi:UDP-N-acetylmuramate dehydrogenase
MWEESLKREIQESTRGMILFDVFMSQYTSLGIGGPADALAFPEDEKDLAALVSMAQRRSIPYYVMGRGTNLLIRERGIRGLVVNLSSGFRKISNTGERISAGAGILLTEMIFFAMERGFSGLSPLYGVPGTVGGGLAMNAGAWGTEVGQRAESIAVMNGDGRVRRLSREMLTFGYRRLGLKEGSIIVGGTFLLEPQPLEKTREEITHYQKKRQHTQPLQFPSAGSIFKNPSGSSAGKIIEEVGLKGRRVGGAEVSVIHGNFIINTGGATADHVLDLIHLIQDCVRRERGIALEPEVRIVGE